MVTLRALCPLRLGLGRTATRVRVGDLFTIDAGSAELMISRRQAEPAPTKKKPTKKKPTTPEE